ncbi:phytanoyl-CoA dioxygenase family protein [Sneathiella litorea]|uniref:Phytanoyl-CoA dioxygenase n=1 Tax=Sneathiella litorea TaxID=2606216 RepID=A0A6L8W7F8_9PROT|nr:phytanoyl-CoA dioxygenase family protein [Sneathiella litorea]MZR30639.1 phytanoyl-CoA dioxygenase [Sneathiella litorea]
MNSIPSKSYGILQQFTPTSIIDEAAEQVANIGYAILDAGYTASEIQGLSEAFDQTHQRYIQTYGESDLRKFNELHTIRSPLTQAKPFLDLALNKNLLSLVKKLIPGKFILNQQNGIINPPQEGYNQDAWHRDLPYQHFVSTKPLAVNVVYCIDDFTNENGATFVLPASHKSEAFPSEKYISNNAIQVEAKAGSLIVLDCMLFHAGGYNKTKSARRAVNHVFNIPYFKQQINIPKNMESGDLSDEARDILGYNYLEPASVSEYLSQRAEK